MAKGFKKGDININRAGRKPNTPNKSTDELRQMVQLFIESNFEDLQKQYNSLEPKDKLNFFERLLKHCLPAPMPELEKLTQEQFDQLVSQLKEQQRSHLKIS